jgi:hypothetical protein
MRRFLLLLATVLVVVLPRVTVAQLPGCTLGGLLPQNGDVYVCTSNAGGGVFSKLVPDAIVNFGASLPPTCTAGAIFTVTGGVGSFNYCNPANTWNAVGGGGRP